MKEIPILFKGEMVRAILEGRKTMTRRIVKDSAWQEDAGDQDPMTGHTPSIHRIDIDRCPYGKPGDRLWVRETWSFIGDRGIFDLNQARPDNCKPIYQADGVDSERWFPSIHMPRWASRILLEVTEVRVERLNDISEADAEAEGVERWVIGDDGWRDYELTPEEEATAGVPPMTAKQSFKTLWQSINGPDSWALNPWVWVVSFKRADP